MSRILDRAVGSGIPAQWGPEDEVVDPSSSKQGRNRRVLVIPPRNAAHPASGRYHTPDVASAPRVLPAPAACEEPIEVRGVELVRGPVETAFALHLLRDAFGEGERRAHQ